MRGAEGGREREGVVRGEDAVLPPHRQGLPPASAGIARARRRGREREREREGGREGGRARQPTAADIAYGLDNKKRRTQCAVGGWWIRAWRELTSKDYRGCMADGGLVHGETW